MSLSYAYLVAIATLAKQAGASVMPIYERPRDEVDTNLKQDGSPLTEADVLAHQLLTKGLQQLNPAIPCLSEEGADVDYALRASWSSYWLIDPIDGTKEFLLQNGDFTVNIALIEDQQVVLGVVYAPALQTCYFAARGLGAFKQVGEGAIEPIAVRAFTGVLQIAASRRHGANSFAALFAQFPDYHLVTRGSSLKFCLIAEGQADLYPRFALTSEWDTAAAQCVLEEAGGSVLDLHGLPLRYNTKASLLNPHFVALGDASIPWLTYLLA